MKAEEVPAERLFQPQQQFLIPVWQRRYSWKLEQWAELWADIGRLESAYDTSHFIGSIVLKALPWSGRPSESRRFWVVDGQQRLTTLTILIAALRDRISWIQSPGASIDETRERLNGQLLRNDNLSEEHRDRLVLQEPDRGFLKMVIDGNVPENSSDLIIKCYYFFKERLAPLDLEALDRVLSIVLTRLDGVWVTLQDRDNAHRVFQTLNAGGKPLQQSDLIRNYFFLLLGDRGEDFYVAHWRPMELHLGSQLEPFFVAWSIAQGHKGSTDSLFSSIQRDLQSFELEIDKVEQYGLRLVADARRYGWLRNPMECPEVSVRPVLRDLEHWGTKPAEGLLLLFLRLQQEGQISVSELEKACEIILGFFARRMLAGYDPNLHKSILSGVAGKIVSGRMSSGTAVDYLHHKLSEGSDVRSFPSDAEVLGSVVSNHFYVPSRQRWAFLILWRINRSLYEHQAHADAIRYEGYTIEHIMPQTLSPAWNADLQRWGVVDVPGLHQTKLHVLGNLTLTAINSHLSNRPLDQKVLELDDDALRINRGLRQFESWGEARIDERSRTLAMQALRAFQAPIPAGQVNVAQYEPVGTIRRSDIEDSEPLEDDGYEQ